MELTSITALVPLTASHSIQQGSALRSREMLPTQINFETVLVPMHESVMRDSSIAGYGASYIEALLEDFTPGQRIDFGGVSDFDNCALIYATCGDFKETGAAINKVADKIIALHAVNLHFEEIKPFTPPSSEDMARRLRFAQNTGFVLVGPGECIAVLRQNKAGDYIFCDTFDCNSEGTVRSLAGYYAESIDHAIKPKTIASLNITQTRAALQKARGDIYWWGRKGMPVNEEQLKGMIRTIKLLEAHEKIAPNETLASGATVIRSFIENGSASSVSELVKRADGWRYYDTYQAAWYFGLWVNPLKLETLCYAEQDVIHVKCDNQHQFEQQLRELAQMYGHSRSPSMAAYGPDGMSVAFESLSFLDGDVKSVTFSDGAPPFALKPGDKPTCPLFGDLRMDHPSVVNLQDGCSTALDGSAFSLDLLNPLTFEGGFSPFLSKIDGSLKVTLNDSQGNPVLWAAVIADVEQES